MPLAALCVVLTDKTRGPVTHTVCELLLVFATETRLHRTTHTYSSMEATGTSSMCQTGDLKDATAFTGPDSDPEQLCQFGGYSHLDPPSPYIKVLYLQTKTRSLLWVNLMFGGFWVYSNLIIPNSF